MASARTIFVCPRGGGCCDLFVLLASRALTTKGAAALPGRGGGPEVWKPHCIPRWLNADRHRRPVNALVFCGTTPGILFQPLVLVQRDLGRTSIPTSLLISQSSAPCCGSSPPPSLAISLISIVHFASTVSMTRPPLSSRILSMAPRSVPPLRTRTLPTANPPGKKRDSLWPTPVRPPG